jgi:hypothetical protein
MVSSPLDWVWRNGTKRDDRGMLTYPTIMKFPASPTSSPFSSFVKPQDFAICRIPAGDGFGGLKSRVTTFSLY